MTLGKEDIEESGRESERALGEGKSHLTCCTHRVWGVHGSLTLFDLSE